MKLGIVLSGGGARGVSHLGVLKALGEFQVKFDCISGASVGALIGAFYCQGRGISKLTCQNCLLHLHNDQYIRFGSKMPEIFQKFIL